MSTFYVIKPITYAGKALPYGTKIVDPDWPDRKVRNLTNGRFICTEQQWKDHLARAEKSKAAARDREEAARKARQEALKNGKPDVNAAIAAAKARGSQGKITL